MLAPATTISTPLNRAFVDRGVRGGGLVGAGLARELKAVDAEAFDASVTVLPASFIPTYRGRAA